MSGVREADRTGGARKDGRTRGARRWRAEARALLGLGAPLAAAQVSQMLMASTTTAVLGHLGTVALAGGGLAAGICGSLLLVAQGTLTGLQPWVAQAKGQTGDRQQDDGPLALAGRADVTRLSVLFGALALATVIALPIMMALCNVAAALRWMAVSPAIAAETAAYCKACAWGVPFALWAAGLRYYLVALEKALSVMAVAIGVALFNGVLCWALAYGRLGSPRLGVFGAGAAAALTWVAMFVGLLVCAFRTGALRRVPQGVAVRGVERGRWLRAIRIGAGRVFRLGWPVSVSYASEIWLFLLFSVLVARLGATALAANQLTMNLTNVMFMVPLAFAQAATVRVARHAGEANGQEIHRAARVALTVSLAYALCCACVLFLWPNAVTGRFIAADDASFASIAALDERVFRLAALYVVADALQSTAAGALRGLKHSRAPMLVALVGFWGIALPAGAWLIHFGKGPFQGVEGLWFALTATQCGVAVTMLALWRRTVKKWMD